MSPVDETQREAAIEIIRDKGWPQMTTPRVYTFMHLHNPADDGSALDAEFILLSDHKEVVKELKAQRNRYVDLYMDDDSARLEIEMLDSQLLKRIEGVGNGRD